MDVVARRQQRVELAGVHRLGPRHLQVGARGVGAVVHPPVDRLELAAAIDADEAPGQVVVHRRLGAGGDHQREQRQRAVLGAIERVLPDTAAHAALRVRRRRRRRAASRRRPAVPQTPASAPRAARPCRACAAIWPARLVDERPDLRGVDEVAERGVVLVLAEIAHARRWYTWPSAGAASPGHQTRQHSAGRRRQRRHRADVIPRTSTPAGRSASSRGRRATRPAAPCSRSLRGTLQAIVTPKQPAR